MLRGSGRSIAGFHLRDALDLVAKREPALIERFGGHAVAAGLTHPRGGAGAFRRRLRAGRPRMAAARRPRARDRNRRPARARRAHVALAERLREPVWGQGFPPPTFDDEFAVASSRVVAGAHTRLVLERGGERFEGVLFRSTQPLPQAIRAVFRPEIDRYRGTAALQLVLQHWQPA